MPTNIIESSQELSDKDFFCLIIILLQFLVIYNYNLATSTWVCSIRILSSVGGYYPAPLALLFYIGPTISRKGLSGRVSFPVSILTWNGMMARLTTDTWINRTPNCHLPKHYSLPIVLTAKICVLWIKNIFDEKISSTTLIVENWFVILLCLSIPLYHCNLRISVVKYVHVGPVSI